MLKDNADAFSSLAPEPMIGTWIPLVYLNKFSANGKTVYTVYNASTSPVRGKLIAATTVNEYHVVDLYRYNKIETCTEADKTILCIDLEPRSVTCIAHLPKLLDVTLRGPKLIVKTPEDMEGATVRVADRSGATIAEGKIRKKACDLSVPLDAAHLICKLYRGRYLIDASSFQTPRTKH